GAANDIEKATRVARAMVTQYGMSEKFGLAQLESPASQYLDDGRIVMNCSDATAAEVDHEVIRILKDSYDQAKKLLSEHRQAMNRIAEFLIEKETITGKEFMDLFYEVEGIDPSEVKKEKEARIKENPAEEIPVQTEDPPEEEPVQAEEQPEEESVQTSAQTDENPAEESE
ncbi:MAG: AAA family ATPase, partial [Lachnospiraceae bacterium]|nr:AAA family ATPase [Lachnospiraceae bacterium]